MCYRIPPSSSVAGERGRERGREGGRKEERKGGREGGREHDEGCVTEYHPQAV